MDFKGPGLSVCCGLRDSIRGFYTAFWVDKELNKRKLNRLSSPSISHSPVRRRQSDSREPTPVRTLQKHEESTVMSRIIQCSMLNGAIFLASILFFDYFFLSLMKISIMFIFGSDSPSGQSVWYWIKLILEYTFHSIWVVPLFTISKFINNLWFQDIGQSAYKYSRGRSSVSLSLSKSVADFIFNTVVESLFLIQAIVMTYIPFEFLGYVLYLIHLSILYSLYAFEYKWGEMGWEIHKRLTCIETNWPYFIAFGLPLVLVTQVTGSWVISGCIFSMLFPFFIISANEASPTKEICPRIKIFSPVIAVSNAIFSRLGKDRRSAGSRGIRR